MSDWDLEIVRLWYPQFAISAGFGVTISPFKLRYSDSTFRKCLCFQFYFMGASLFINIPMWVDS